MSTTTSHGGLTIATELYNFVNDDLLRGAPITAQAFWDGFDAAVHRLAPKNAELLAQRSKLQAQIDSWLATHSHTDIRDALRERADLRKTTPQKDPQDQD